MCSPVLFCATLLLLAGALARGGDAPDSQPDKESAALRFPFSYTGEGLANLAGGYKRGAVYEGLVSLGAQGDLGRLAGWEGGSFLVSALYPHGPSLTDKYVHDFNRVSSIDAYDSVRLYEAWVQQEFAAGKLSLRVGQILADTEFFVSENAALFVNGAFGAIPLVSQNFPAPVFPVAAPGARLRWTVSDALSVQAAVFDGDAGNPARDNKHGVDWHLGGNDGVLALAEAAFTRKAGEGGLAGVYKLGAFYHRSGTDDFFPGLESLSSAGGYFIADQQLWRRPGTGDQGLSGFVRIGGAPSDRSVVPFYADAGFNFKGLVPGREKDIAGVGVSFTRISGSLHAEEGGPLAAHHETILEATYKIQATEWLTVQPDVQYLFNPGATLRQTNALVAGMRFALSF